MSLHRRLKMHILQALGEYQATYDAPWEEFSAAIKLVQENKLADAVHWLEDGLNARPTTDSEIPREVPGSLLRPPDRQD